MMSKPSSSLGLLRVAVTLITFNAIANLLTAETICVWVWSLVTILTEPE